MNLPLHPVDIAFTCYLIYAIYKGVRRGLASELARLGGGLLVVGLAWYYHQTAGIYLIDHTRIQTGKTAFPVAFAGLLIVGYVVLLAVRLLLKAVLDFKFKGLLERIGGGLVGGLRAGLVVVAIIFLVYLGSDGPFYNHVATESKVGAAIAGHALSAYERAATEYPDLRLPLRSVEEASPEETIGKPRRIIIERPEE